MAEEKKEERPKGAPSEAEGKKQEEKAQAEKQEPKEEKAKESAKGGKEDKTEEAKVELSEKSKTIADTLEGMTVLELSDLVKALEDKFGVTAQAPMAMVGAAMPGAGAAAAEEKTSFTVVLKEIGSNKIQVIKEIRAVTSLGLKEAKDLVEAAPKPIKEGATKEEADKIKAQIEKVGAKVVLQ